MKGEWNNSRLACDKLLDDMPRLVGYSASEPIQPIALRHAGYTVAHLKSYRGAPDLREANWETLVRYLKGDKVFL